MKAKRFFLVVFMSVISYGVKACADICVVDSINIDTTSSIAQNQDNRDPKEINSSAESRKGRKADQLQKKVKLTIIQ